MKQAGYLGRATRRLGSKILKRLPPDAQMLVRNRFGPPRPWDPGVSLEPPRSNDDMPVGPPDFVGVGAQKSGTSWWFRLITSHPEVYYPPEVHKEIHFFKDFWRLAFTPADAHRYHRWFPRPSGRTTGEWTPDYMARFWIPPLLKVAAPEAKLLVLLRDPIERYVSALAHHTSRGQLLNPTLITDAQQRGFYAAQLSRLEQLFPRERILVLQYEQCVMNPVRELRKTYGFLGIEDLFVPDGIAETVHKTSATKLPPDRHTREILVNEYESDVELLMKARPELDLSLWPNFAHLA